MEWLLSLLAGLLLGGGAGVLVLRARAEAEYQRGRGESAVAQASIEGEKLALIARERDLMGRLSECDSLLTQLREHLGLRERELAAMQATLQQERRQHEEKLALLAEAREALTLQFKTLATDILEEKSKRFTEQNQTNLSQLLTPLSERIQAFSKQVQDTYDKDSKERLTLEVELKNLQALNTRLNQDAVALTNALTGANSKAQGSWGEMVLERVLETSGLQKGREYRVQVSDIQVRDEGTVRYQPDVIIDLPEGKQLVVDSKVSLNAYTRYVKAEDDATREVELKAHILALRSHIKTLSEKRYQDLYSLNTLDFVFMFVPVEPAYLLAVQHDMNLFNEAFEQRIMIVGPSTLLATLRTVASIWRYEYQNQNAQEIARQSGAMYDKFVGFVDSLEKVGKQLDGTRDTWQDAMKKLRDGRGNLITSAEKLRKLGIKANKQLAAHLLGHDEAADDAGEAEEA
ncbi:MAG: DNA recombination protein RmuC [Paludibacterium sp.]|uniref:DNA recombination protein RmuC n=1 Tax=Paludibacterium sp. TaxID=1917523 RepID=UPI0025D019FF|nr:DNA recombination protein RmuC [Paludibacterium sp.]MBV8049419.1 DNA recombination protein RmuC [Paludibacterium sp.]MBV8645792.1 DNA recombination protein RmuC [Paludibacterium sp.]